MEPSAILLDLLERQIAEFKRGGNVEERFHALHESILDLEGAGENARRA